MAVSTSMMKNVYSVGQVNAYIKKMFAQDFLLQRVSVKGEVSNCKYHSSGHIYFTLKDAGGAISAVMFAGDRRGLAFQMKDGDNVVATGPIQVYERDGKYQLYAKQIQLDGAGALYVEFERLKKELEEMGMFAPEYKQPIPKYARKVGIVTAPTGAAIQDIINISKRRNPFVQLILYPALVQGDGAVQSIINGIYALDRFGVDVMIVGRGGGSIEDLWAFNEEGVARAIFDCSTPIISAVGHETDTTIADYVADLRAPTPSAAAELAVCEIAKVLTQIDEYQIDLDHVIFARIDRERTKLQYLNTRLKLYHPQAVLHDQQNRLVQIEEALLRILQTKLTDRKHTLSLYAQRLEGKSPLKQMAGGYSFTAGADGHAIRSIDAVSVGDTVNIYVSDGKLAAEITDKTKG